MIKIHREYHDLLIKLDKVDTMRSNYRPWPNPTVAVMCSYNWVERTEPNGDLIRITDLGREILNTAEVHK